MGWFLIVIRVIPTIIKLMGIAEALFDDVPDSGSDKKDMVVATIKALIEGASGFTGTPELWEKIDKAVSLIIDAATLFLFPHEDTK